MGGGGARPGHAGGNKPKPCPPHVRQTGALSASLTLHCHSLTYDFLWKLILPPASLQNPDPNLDKPAYDPEQLEDCDTAAEDLLLIRLDGSSHQLTNYGQLGATQHLFNMQVSSVRIDCALFMLVFLSLGFVCCGVLPVCCSKGGWFLLCYGTIFAGISRFY